MTFPEEESSGSTVKLKPWNQRKGRLMGHEAPGGRAVPLIDRIHRLMHQWRGGDVHKVDEYLDENGLRRHELLDLGPHAAVGLHQVGDLHVALGRQLVALDHGFHFLFAGLLQLGARVCGLCCGELRLERERAHVH